jgi:hypothetical protein
MTLLPAMQARLQEQKQSWTVLRLCTCRRKKRKKVIKASQKSRTTLGEDRGGIYDGV